MASNVERVIYGVGPTGKPVPVAVDASGAINGGGGGGTTTVTGIGGAADPAAPSGGGNGELIAQSKRANITQESILSQLSVLTSIDNKIKGKAVSASLDSVTTSATGATFVPLPAGVCTEVALINTMPITTDIEIRRGSAGETFPLPAGSSTLMESLTNSSELEIRRFDQSNTPVVMKFERRTR